MNVNQGIKVISILLLAGLICDGCQKSGETISPVPATNAPVLPPPAPTNAAVADAMVTNISPAAAAESVLTPEEARNHIGESATVRGKVFGVHVTAKGDAFINVGAAYPNQPFTVVCFQGGMPEEDLKKLEGKTVSFKGKIKDHNDQPEIILDTADQISE